MSENRALSSQVCRNSGFSPARSLPPRRTSVARRIRPPLPRVHRPLEQFWSRMAGELHWFKKWDKVLDWNLPYAKWFVGGKTTFPTIAWTIRSSLAAATRRDSLGRRAESGTPGSGGSVHRISYRQLATTSAVLQTAQATRRQEGRSRHDLHAMVPEAPSPCLPVRGSEPRIRDLRRLSSQATPTASMMPTQNIIITANGWLPLVFLFSAHRRFLQWDYRCEAAS